MANVIIMKFHAIRATIVQLLSDTYVPDMCACGIARIPRRIYRRHPGNCCWPPSWNTAHSVGNPLPIVELKKERGRERERRSEKLGSI